MGKTVNIVSDFSGKEIPEMSAYGLTVTNFSTKTSARFYISHEEFMNLVKEHGLKPEWQPWGNQ